MNENPKWYRFLTWYRRIPDNTPPFTELVLKRVIHEREYFRTAIWTGKTLIATDGGMVPIDGWTQCAFVPGHKQNKDPKALH